MEQLTQKEMDKLINTSILELAHQLDNVLMNDLVHEDTTVFEFIRHYLNE